MRGAEIALRAVEVVLMLLGVFVLGVWVAALTLGMECPVCQGKGGLPGRPCDVCGE